MSVIIETTIGDFTIDLMVDRRPQACKNFLKLCKMKYYNFCLFHSVQPNFLAQTGDPMGTGSGGESIYGLLYGEKARYFESEVMPKVKHIKPGLLSMVNCGNNMLGSQFFVTLGEELVSLDGEHCVFGEITEGIEIIHKFNETICDTLHRPYKDIRITHTIILEDPFEDPSGLVAPDVSPEPTQEKLANGRIGADEEIDETVGMTVAEVEEMKQEREAKARATILEIVGDLPDAEIAPPENVLFVCKLNPVTTDNDLDTIFGRFGKIKSCEIIRDKNTGDSLQYAFIEFEDRKSCEVAYFKMENVLIDDRRIKVDFSQSVAKEQRIRWKGKGRGIEHLRDEDDVKDSKPGGQKEKDGKHHTSKRDRDYEERDRRRDRNREREDDRQVRDRNRNKESDDRYRRRHEKDYDRERSKDRSRSDYRKRDKHRSEEHRDDEKRYSSKKKEENSRKREEEPKRSSSKSDVFKHIDKLKDEKGRNNERKGKEKKDLNGKSQQALMDGTESSEKFEARQSREKSESSREKSVSNDKELQNKTHNSSCVIRTESKENLLSDSLNENRKPKVQTELNEKVSTPRSENTNDQTNMELITLDKGGKSPEDEGMKENIESNDDRDDTSSKKSLKRKKENKYSEVRTQTSKKKRKLSHSKYRKKRHYSSSSESTSSTSDSSDSSSSSDSSDNRHGKKKKLIIAKKYYKGGKLVKEVKKKKRTQDSSESESVTDDSSDSGSKRRRKSRKHKKVTNVYKQTRRKSVHSSDESESDSSSSDNSESKKKKRSKHKKNKLKSSLKNKKKRKEDTSSSSESDSSRGSKSLNKKDKKLKYSKQKNLSITNSD